MTLRFGFFFRYQEVGGKEIEAAVFYD